MPAKKPQVQIRKPPVAVPASADAFVAGERPDIQTPERLGVQPPEPPTGSGGNDVPTPHHTYMAKPAEASKPPTGKALVARKSGATLRRMTIYLPPDLARSYSGPLLRANGT